MIIKIKDLTFETIIGVLDFERVTPQRVVVNLKAKYDYKDGNYINYVELRNLIVKSMQEQKFELLEDALNFITEEIKDKFPTIQKIKLEISKPDILQDCIVSVGIEKQEVRVKK